ncbi:von Willebrand factor type A domain-containing protein [Pedobacter sp. SYP-B3415]|uniref:YfbK domain-containing protein n=1 Tax=Pedobacter sp. SYP-B3415 TaxID=2496641 RepID=UPI00101B6305|nr:von Willebrand factor type A domain-containing protein [Pedobacter sp. SYP-B3415]
MKTLFAFLSPLIALVIFFSPQSKKLTGTVTEVSGAPLPNVRIVVYPSGNKTVSDKDGRYSIPVQDKDSSISFTALGFRTVSLPVKNKTTLSIKMEAAGTALSEIVIQGSREEKQGYVGAASAAIRLRGTTSGLSVNRPYAPNPVQNTESYASVAENGFKRTDKDPLSTFSVDVDAASYSNVRRFLNGGALPPADAVRIEEMINYFDYNYPDPGNADPVNILTEASAAPWNKQHHLVKIALQAKRIDTRMLPASNLVFLIDVSGSMADQNKLPLLISSFKMLTEQLRSKDKVSIVVYAGNSGLVLPATAGDKKAEIAAALNRLQAGGSTAGGAGLDLAYRTASENFIKGGNNRVILATDGDFNVGPRSDEAMKKLIESKRGSGIFLTVLGYGMGNYKDSKMETLADRGNGNYAYIDNIQEAKKVLVNEFGGTLFTVAKDVKLQIEFNPAAVQAYRLVGYENRLLADEDFNNDKKDAGDMGSGHTVTALYEVIPTGVKSDFSVNIDPLKYQQNEKPKAIFGNPTEMLTVKIRYKHPQSAKSMLLSKILLRSDLKAKPSEAFQFASAVAEFGMLLKNSEFKQQSDFGRLIERAKLNRGVDAEGYRAEFIRMAGSASIMAKDLLTSRQKHMPDEEN